MRKKDKRKINMQSGAAMLISVIFFIFISLAIIAGLVSPVVREFKNASTNLNSKKSFFLAESGSEDASYRIVHNQTIGNSETITLDSNSVITNISTLVGNTKQIISLGDISNYQRKSSVTLKAGDGVVFKYGTQAGQGGFVFQNNSHVSGSIYSNGPIVGSNGAYVTGDAFSAGSSGSISNMRVGYNGLGIANASDITGSTVTGNLYCKTGSGNNKSCDTTQPIPTEQDLPITDEEIVNWKGDAEGGEIFPPGNKTISTATTWGLKKINGNLTINSGVTLTISNTIYVTGNLIINGTVKLDSSYGSSSGIIIADGYIYIGNNVTFTDSGTPGSYILLLSNSTCDESITNGPCFGKNAIEVYNNSKISIVNAQKGTVYFKNNAEVKESVGKKIQLQNNVGISYGTGLINVGFTSGPSGSWTLDSWGETQ